MSDKRVSEMTDDEVREMAGGGQGRPARATAGPGDIEQALELRSRIRHAIKQGDGSAWGESIRMDTAETTLHFRWMGHEYVLTITDQTPEGT